MNQDEIEKQLRALPPRHLPEAWRREIIATAMRKAKAARARTSWAVLLELIRNLFMGNPVTGTAFAAVWMAILFFKFNTPHDSQADQMQVVQINPSQSLYLVSMTQQMELAELDSNLETDDHNHRIP